MCVDISAMASIASSVNSSVTFSVPRRAVYCLIKLLSGSFKIFIKSFFVKEHLIQHVLEAFPAVQVINQKALQVEKHQMQ